MRPMILPCDGNTLSTMLCFASIPFLSTLPHGRLPQRTTTGRCSAAQLRRLTLLVTDTLVSYQVRMANPMVRPIMLHRAHIVPAPLCCDIQSRSSPSGQMDTSRTFAVLATASLMVAYCRFDESQARHLELSLAASPPSCLAAFRPLCTRNKQSRSYFRSVNRGEFFAHSCYPYITRLCRCNGTPMLHPTQSRLEDDRGV